MDFYAIVIILAIIILILVLTYIGIAMSKMKMSKVFPPNANVCPDYWEEIESGKCVFPKAGTRNTGDFTTPIPYGSANTLYKTDITASAGYTDANNTYLSNSGVSSIYGKTTASYVNGTTNQIKEVIKVSPSDDSLWTAIYPGMTASCAKKKWATKNKIAWDGITNSNIC